MKTFIRLAAVSALLAASPALAHGDKPADPVKPDPLAYTLNNAFHGTQMQGQAQAQGQQQGQIANGGNSISKATGGQGGNAHAAGGNQHQSAQGGSIGNISVDASSRAAAASAIAPSVAGCSRQGGGFSAAMQVIGWGVSASRCKGFVGPEVIQAEELFLQGRPASVAYLCRFDNSACDAFEQAGYVRRAR